MLEEDRVNIDHNFRILRAQPDKEYLKNMPNPCYGNHLDGRELTVWMIRYFETLKDTGDRPDMLLAGFNYQRRSQIKLPDTWNSPPQEMMDAMWEKLSKLGYEKSR